LLRTGWRAHRDGCLGAQHTCLAEPVCTASARALQLPWRLYTL
jgi:hypothetical protein